MSDKVVVLTVRSQKAAGEKVFRLHKKRAVFGSATSSDVRLDNESVSPVHAILEVNGVDGKPVIYDLASDSGIQVNGKPTVQSTLQPNDQVSIGPYLIAVRIETLSEVSSPSKDSLGQKLFMNEKEDLASLLLEDEREVIDIFDHRPEMKTSLQVVMFFESTILDVEHFVDKKRVVIGPGTHEDFGIPPFWGEGKGGRFELVTNDKGNYVLHLHESMEGVVSRDGQLVPVRDLMSSASSKTLPLVEKDFAKVRLKDVSFFLNFTPAPPRLKRQRILERDPFFVRVWAASLVLTCLLLFAMSSLKVNPVIEIEQLPERVATIIYEPKFLPIEHPPQPKEKQEEVVRKPPTPPKKEVIKVQPKQPTTPAPPKPLIGKNDSKQNSKAQSKHPAPAKHAAQTTPRAAVASGHEGAGAKAKGDEGARGAHNKPQTPAPQTAAKRPGEGKHADVAMNRGHSQTDSLGVVDVFKSDKGTLSKVLAAGRGASNAAKSLEGYSGFTSKGEGGLGAAGTAAGGGGTSQGLGGLADKGIGGGKTGTGLGALGSGGNILGGKGRLAIESGGSPEPIVLGSIDTDAIAREIAKHRDEIKYCYEKEINADHPDLAGRIGIRFVIGSSGAVSTAGLSSSSLKNVATESCVIAVIKRIQFPPVRGGGIAEVTYPFVFKPSNK